MMEARTGESMTLHLMSESWMPMRRMEEPQLRVKVQPRTRPGPEMMSMR
jgi:hypothetical protein